MDFAKKKQFYFLVWVWVIKYNFIYNMSIVSCIYDNIQVISGVGLKIEGVSRCMGPPSPPSLPFMQLGYRLDNSLSISFGDIQFPSTPEY